MHQNAQPHVRNAENGMTTYVKHAISHGVLTAGLFTIAVVVQSLSVPHVGMIDVHNKDVQFDTVHIIDQSDHDAKETHRMTTNQTPTTRNTAGKAYATTLID